MTRVISVVFLSLLFGAVFTGPVERLARSSPNNGVGNLLGGIFSDLKSSLIDTMKDIQISMKEFPANYKNSTIRTDNMNGTIVQTNTTIIKETKNNQTRFRYAEKQKIIGNL